MDGCTSDTKGSAEARNCECKVNIAKAVVQRDSRLGLLSLFRPNITSSLKPVFVRPVTHPQATTGRSFKDGAVSPTAIAVSCLAHLWIRCVLVCLCSMCIIISARVMLCRRASRRDGQRSLYTQVCVGENKAYHWHRCTEPVGLKHFFLLKSTIVAVVCATANRLEYISHTPYMILESPPKFPLWYSVQPDQVQCAPARPRNPSNLYNQIRTPSYALVFWPCGLQYLRFVLYACPPTEICICCGGIGANVADRALPGIAPAIGTSSSSPSASSWSKTGMIGTGGRCPG